MENSYENICYSLARYTKLYDLIFRIVAAHGLGAVLGPLSTPDSPSVSMRQNPKSRAHFASDIAETIYSVLRLLIDSRTVVKHLKRSCTLRDVKFSDICSLQKLWSVLLCIFSSKFSVEYCFDE